MDFYAPARIIRDARDHGVEMRPVVIWPDLYEKQRRIVLTALMLGIQGMVQREGEVIHIIAARLFDLTPMLATLGQRSSGTALDDSGSGKSMASPLRLKSRNFH